MPRPVKGAIYKITNRVNGKAYIGQTTMSLTRRFNNHCYTRNARYRSAIYEAIQKYGRENFIIELLEAHSTREALNEAEVRLIAQLNTLVPAGYNLTTGGDYKYSLTEDGRRRISEANAKRIRTVEEKAKISQTLTGRKTGPCSEKRRESIKAAKRSKPISEETRAKLSAAGRKGVETRRKQRASQG